MQEKNAMRFELRRSILQFLLPLRLCRSITTSTFQWQWESPLVADLGTIKRARVSCPWSECHTCFIHPHPLHATCWTCWSLGRERIRFCLADIACASLSIHLQAGGVVTEGDQGGSEMHPQDTTAAVRGPHHGVSETFGQVGSSSHCVLAAIRVLMARGRAFKV